MNLIQKSLHAYALATCKIVFHFRFHSTSHFGKNNCHCPNSDGTIWINHDKRHENKTKILSSLCLFSINISVGIRLSFAGWLFPYSLLYLWGEISHFPFVSRWDKGYCLKQVAGSQHYISSELLDQKSGFVDVASCNKPVIRAVYKVYLWRFSD